MKITKNQIKHLERGIFKREFYKMITDECNAEIDKYFNR